MITPTTTKEVIQTLAGEYGYAAGFDLQQSAIFAEWWLVHRWDGVTAWPAYDKDEVRKDLLEWRNYKL